MKQFEQFQKFIDSVKRNEKSIIFAEDYIVLSKEAYDVLIGLHHPEIKPISYDESLMQNWITKRFLDSNDDE